MFSFVFPEKRSLSRRIGSHNHIAEIYRVSADAVLCVFASVVLYSSVEIATLGMTYIYDSPVFVGDPGGIRTPDLHRDRVACLSTTPRGHSSSLRYLEVSK